MSQPVQTRSNRFSPVNQSLPALTIILTMIVRVQVFSIFSVLIEKKIENFEKKALLYLALISLKHRHLPDTSFNEPFFPYVSSLLDKFLISMKVFSEEKVLKADNFTRLKKLILIRNLSVIEFYTLIL